MQIIEKIENRRVLSLKKLKRIAYIVLIVIVAVLSLTIYTNASRDNGESQKEKIFSEIKFIETKMENLFNTMNHIEVRNYKVVTSELSKESTEKSSSGGSSQSESGGNSSGNTSENTESQDEQDKKKFELKVNGVLTNTDEINWDSVKSEIENLYTSLPSITMDLYQSNINQEDILGFNTEYDKLTSVAKDEKKEEMLTELTQIYEYLPKFLRGSEQEELETALVETKYNIFKAYSKLDRQNWEEISSDIRGAVDSYSKLLTNTEIDARKQYNISKGYIMLNELQNAVNIQDTSVFLIKYKNLLEEINNI